jgi:tRNA(Ile)-lysidine synthase
MTAEHKAGFSETERDALLDGLAAFRSVILAVSGGSDSMALMALVADWRNARCAAGLPMPDVRVMTVDHGLRSESAGEAEYVAATARDLGLAHRVLRWTGPKPATGLQAAARAARYDLLAAHVARMPAEALPAALVTAHTRDDQVETFLMRLARGSSLDGVSGMRACRPLAPLDPTSLLRPLLGITRDRLRSYLIRCDLDWIEDPSNENADFERVRLRNAQADLTKIGLDRHSIALTVSRLAAERDGLDWLAARRIRDATIMHAPGVLTSVSAEALRAGPTSVAGRALRFLLHAMGDKAEPVALTGIEECVERLSRACDGYQETIGGCLIRVEGGAIWFVREPPRAALATDTFSRDTPFVHVWDNRLRMVWPGGAHRGGQVHVAIAAERDCVDLPELSRPDGVPKSVWATAVASAPVVRLSWGAEDQASWNGFTPLIWRAAEAAVGTVSNCAESALVAQPNSVVDALGLEPVRLYLRRLSGVSDDPGPQ